MQHGTQAMMLFSLIWAIGSWTALGVAGQPTDANSRAEQSLIQSISKVTLRRNRDGQGVTWFHPRACLRPGPDGKPIALMTLQEIGGSDYFGPVHWSESGDGGHTWSEPALIPSLAREPVEGHPGLMAGVCDVTPQYHPQTGTVLALGHVVFYRGPRFARGDQLARYPVYAVRRKDGSWSERKILKWDDPRGANIYSNNCGQRVVLPNGDIAMSFTFGPTANNRMVAGVRCSFDGEELKILKVGPPLKNPVGRGLLEPSVTQFHDRFYLTIRAEDGHGYVAVSKDGLNYERKTAWTWDDGAAHRHVHHPTTLAHPFGRVVSGLHAEGPIERERHSLAKPAVGGEGRSGETLFDEEQRTGRASAGGRWRQQTRRSRLDGELRHHERQPRRILGHGGRMAASPGRAGRFAAGKNPLDPAERMCSQNGW